MWNRDLNTDEIEAEKKLLSFFDEFLGNSGMNLLKFNSENLEADERINIVKHGKEIISSYGLLLVGHIANRFDSWVVLNSLVKTKTDLSNVINR